jgi:hypothetical protein
LPTRFRTFSFEDVRQERVRTIREVGDDYLAGYKPRNPQSAIFAEYAVGHVKRLLGDKMLVDVSDQTVRDYQDLRLGEKAGPKSINEEVGCPLRLMGDRGDVLRARLRKKKLLKRCYSLLPVRDDVSAPRSGRGPLTLICSTLGCAAGKPEFVPPGAASFE